MFRCDRDRHGGGVCVYTRKDLAVNPRNDLQNPNLEAIWIELLLPKSKPILCGTVYRPPTQSDFFSHLESVYSSINIGMETIILGDFNVDIIKKCHLYSMLTSFCNLFNFHQLISEATRVSSNSETCIDLIFTTDVDLISNSGVIHSTISDHFIIFCTRKVTKQLINEHNNVKFRSMKQYNKDDFQQSLLSADWSPVLTCDIVTEAWDYFSSIFMSCVNNIAPVKECRLKQRTQPWMTSDILDHIKQRDKAFYNYRKNKSDETFSLFSRIRNETQKLVFKAKRDYFKNKLNDSQNDSKSLWKILKSLGLPSKKSNESSSKIVLNIDGEITFDNLKVSEEFNSFYTNVASKLVDKLPTPSRFFSDCFVFNFYSSKGVVPNNFSFKLVSEVKIFKHLNCLSSSKATGLDGIPARFVKDGASIIAGPLSHIVNLSIIQGSVPDSLKLARVTPLFKKNDKTQVGNYRPVSVLSIISKVFERVIYDQLEGYLNEKNLLYNFQSGFRKGYSTDTCLIHLSDFIRFSMDQGQMVGMVLLDLQKAFDTVDHGVLLMKLHAIGLHADAIRWFRSYLTGRNQCVDISGTLSSKASVTCGVPQGSILGPLLFLIYVNDLSGVVKGKVLLYADDTGILVSGKSKSEIEAALSRSLELVSAWLVDNKLSLHLGKTESILFGSKPKVRKNTGLNVQCNGISIAASTSVKYLGAILDQSLSGESIATSLIGKINSRLKFLYRNKKYLSMHNKKLLVSSLIQCHYDYACSFWYPGLTQHLKTRLQTCQNKVIRFILNMDVRSHVGKEQFVFLNWLPVSFRVDQIILSHVHKIRYGSAPDYLGEHFKPLGNVHTLNTRSNKIARPNKDGFDFIFEDSGRFSKPRVRSFGERSFACVGINLWNNLPQQIRDIKGHNSFKHAIKKHLLSLL